jgi:8-oxo-dGTP diphosphatase
MSKEIPSPGEKHYTSTVFLITETTPQQVLLVHHKKMDRWMPPGGHQEEDENAYQTAIREVKEETGIDIAEYLPTPKQIDDQAVSLALPRYVLEERIDARDEQPEHFHLDFIYVVAVPHQEVTYQETESHSIGWFTEEEVEKLPIFKNVAVMINAIFNSLEV